MPTFPLDTISGKYNDFVIDIKYGEMMEVSVRDNRPRVGRVPCCDAEDSDEHEGIVEICQKNRSLVAIFTLYSLYGVEISPEI